jgi:acyl carrier protein
VSRQVVEQAFVTALGVPADTNFDELAYGQQKEWDSVGHMALVAELEERFDIMLDTDDVVDMSSFPVALDILKRYDVEL